MKCNAVRKVQDALSRAGVSFKSVDRAAKISYAPYDLIITVGGDGTFLDAARRVRKQLIFGVNSDPARSVGEFCAGDAGHFETLFHRLLAGKAHITELHRLRLKINGSPKDLDFLNDLLIAHENPARMSRYILKIKKRVEFHSSSGLWISTAAGSTGAIASAGGWVYPKDSRKIQYRSRELYRHPGKKLLLKGGTLAKSSDIMVESMMDEGMIYVDGDGVRVRFRHGAKLGLKDSPYPLCVVTKNLRKGI